MVTLDIYFIYVKSFTFFEICVIGNGSLHVDHFQKRKHLQVKFSKLCIENREFHMNYAVHLWFVVKSHHASKLGPHHFGTLGAYWRSMI